MAMFLARFEHVYDRHGRMGDISAAGYGRVSPLAHATR